MYDMLYTDCLNFPNKISWATLLWNLLANLGFMEAWIQQNIEDANIFLSVVKQRLSDNFIQNWNWRLNESSRALFYRIFSFGYKSYLDTVTINKLRVALTWLRLSSHRLEIETVRWAKPNSIPIENRLCTSCYKLGDEFHFVLDCTRYDDLRQTLIPNYYHRRPNMLKLIELFTTEIKKIQKKWVLFTFKAFQIMEQYIFR